MFNEDKPLSIEKQQYPCPEKHYRYCINTELEQSIFMEANTFDEQKITRAFKRKGDNFLSKTTQQLASKVEN
jgi:hypothetical protein